MPIKVVCSGCAKTYAVNEQLVGKKVRCKGCGSVMVVDGAAGGAVAPRSVVPVTARAPASKAVQPQASASPPASSVARPPAPPSDQPTAPPSQDDDPFANLDMLMAGAQAAADQEAAPGQRRGPQASYAAAALSPVAMPAYPQPAPPPAHAHPPYAAPQPLPYTTARRPVGQIAEGATGMVPMLLLLYLLSLLISGVAGSIGLSNAKASAMEDYRNDPRYRSATAAQRSEVDRKVRDYMAKQDGQGYGVIWGAMGAIGVLHFAVYAPLATLGPVISSAIFRLPVPDGNYLRSAAIWSIPVTAGVAGGLLLPTLFANLMPLLALPLTYLAASAIYGYRPGAAAVAWAFSLVILVIGVVIVVVVAGVVLGISIAAMRGF